MQIKEYGCGNEKTMLFLPGAFSNYSWYLPAIQALSKTWHVYLVVYDGYHEPFDQSFQSVEKSAENIIGFFKEKKIHDLDLVYGLSLGGSTANLIYAFDQLRIKYLVIDGGIAPYELPYFVTRLILFRDVLGIKMIRRNTKLIKMAFSPDRWLYPWEDETSYEETKSFLNKLSDDTIKNCFDSCNNYKMPDPLPVNDTKIYYLYGELEKKARAFDIDYFHKIYPQARFRAFHDMEHGELSTIQYEKFLSVIDEIESEHS
ncbi:MAG: alpha/beta hydrolase [Tissierellia bacterium]|nr:alpha/beta hydrolase [Tissierellia bacterium]